MSDIAKKILHYLAQRFPGKRTRKEVLYDLVCEIIFGVVILGGIELPGDYFK